MNLNKQDMRQPIRQYVLAYLATKPAPIHNGDPNQARGAQTADRLAAVGAAQNGAATVEPNQLQRRIDAAIVQILGRKPGPEPGDFTRAMQTVFVADASGRIVFKPLGQGPAQDALAADPPEQTELPEAQAALLRHVRLLGRAARRFLSDLELPGPPHGADDIAGQRAIIDELIAAVVDECGRADGIRSRGLNASLATLKRLVRTFGAATMLDGSGNGANAVAPAACANFQALTQHVLMMEQACQAAEPLINRCSGSDSVRADRIKQGLLSAANAHAALLRAYDALGFGPNERQSPAATLDQLGLCKQAPTELLTVQDLAEWTEYFLGEHGPVLASHPPGIPAIADQADALFIVLARISIAAAAFPPPYDKFTEPSVARALYTLLTRLDSLARLAENNGGIS